MEPPSEKNFTPVNTDSADTTAPTEQKPTVPPYKNPFIILAVITVLFILGFVGIAFSKRTQSSKIAQVPTPTKKVSVSSTPTPTKTTPTVPIATPTRMFVKTTATPAPPTATSTPTTIPTPTLTPVPPDTEPPHTNIFYPQNGGEMTYTYPDHGGYCVVANAPTDNRDRWQQIETQFHFDSEPYSSYATERAFMCVPSLPNGPHTFTYRSKDSSGNVEAEQTISFTVNIPATSQ